jgi:tetratricopeptide (TPR) repeat protein
MPLVNYFSLFTQAGNLYHSGQVNAAVKAYLDIARLAKTDDARLQAKALHLAGESTILAIMEPTSSYYRDALTYLRSAQEGYAKLKDANQVGLVTAALGSAAAAAGLADEAEARFRSAQLALGDRSNETARAIVFAKMGLLHLAQQRFPEAEQFLLQALHSLRLDPAASFFHAETLLDMAKFEFVRSHIDEAISAAEEGQSWFDADHEPEVYSYYQAEAAALLAILYADHDDKKRAKIQYDRFTQFSAGFDPLVTKRFNKKLEALARLHEATK